ncbi:MAG: amino acid permease [Candidatus Margulisiibacteriota bacterium]
MSEKPQELEHALGKLNLVNLGIGAIIGAGIFVLTGQAAAQYAGPGIVISFIISGIVCALAGLCYAEFASMLPQAGSAYTYARYTLGNFMAWIIGWDLILEYLFASSTVAVGWSGYVVNFLSDFGIHIPQTLCQAPFNHTLAGGWVSTGAYINVPAMLIVLAITLLLMSGIKASAKVNNWIVFIKLAVIFAFIGFGIKYINPANWTPFIPPNTGEFGHYGWSGILRGAAVIFFAYIGFDAVSTTAQEAKSPQTDMPVGILGSLGISTIIYILVSLVLTGLVGYTALNVADPIAVGINAAGPGLAWLRPFIKLGAIFGLSSVILVMIMGQSRIFYAMAKDGFLPKVFSRVHEKWHTPYITTLISGLAAMVIAGLFPIGLLGELVSIGTLLAFAIVCIAVLVLRKTKPDLHRPFRTPWVPVVPVLGATAAFVQMAALPKDTWIRLVAWMAIGLLIYYFYSRKHIEKMD